MEHRASVRTNTDLLAELITPNKHRAAGRLKNISLLGVFIATAPDEYRLHQALHLVVRLTNATYTLKGNIVRLQDNGIAIELDANAQSYHQSASLLRAIKSFHSEALPGAANKLVNE
ncbi:PilZ domain-containing protein [Gilvimarinus sp. DA14]|uniref:PilZ domain-containing protein n=1 Tax=Gilvimarinus sp. DA14 TaxID=2956798 RepID=UPI0020B734B3|nr:PilZ domain-containing protein [Gilvimarinus sp. DA14]UTF60666.1 PilZ domain-containing protein [Gilvimarinus sp. DA14]